MDYVTCKFMSSMKGRESESALTTEANELRVVAEASSTFTETGSTDTSADGNPGKGTDETLRDQDLENEIKELRESYSREMEKNWQMNAEVRHYAESLTELEEKYQAVLRSKEDEFKKYCNRYWNLQNQIEELTKSLKVVQAEKQTMERMESTYTTKIKSLEKQLDNCRKRLLEEQTRSKQLNQDIRHYMSRLSHEECKCKKLEEDLGHCTESYNFLRDRYNYDIEKMANRTDYLESRLLKKDDELRILHGELRDKTARLASVFEKRLKHDQRRVENTIEFNTPTDVEKDFKDFFDGERIDACDIMESTLEPKEEIDLDLYYPRLACVIFVTAYEQVKEAREAACDLFENVTRQLIDETPKLSQEFCLNRKEGGYSAHFPINIDVSVAKKDQEISTDVVDGLMLCLKQTAHSCKLDCFENDVKEIVWERWKKYLNEEKTPLLPALSQDVLIELSDYIKACIRLTWRMVTQMPPLQLEYKSIKFDKDIHRLSSSQQCNTEYSRSEDQPWGQAKIPNENIACYMWPALLEGGGRIIFPGEVFMSTETSCMAWTF